jgi:site-specific recombinase XerD
MRARVWADVTCQACGTTAAGVRSRQLCMRCYSRARRVVVCTDCGQERKHAALGMCGTCWRRSRTREQRCRSCGEIRVIAVGDRCNACAYRQRARPGMCRDCGRNSPRLSAAARCNRCMRRRLKQAPCTDCGVVTEIRARGWCSACYTYRAQYEVATCPECRRELPLGPTGLCRICLAVKRGTAFKPDPAGQQLLAELTEYGQARGWGRWTMPMARRSVKAILAQERQFGTGPWNEAVLRQYLLERQLLVQHTIEFLITVGYVTPSPEQALMRAIELHIEPLPGTIRGEVLRWIEALRGRGRRHRRALVEDTIRNYIYTVRKPLAEWASRYESLRQVTADDVDNAISKPSGAKQRLTASALRSLFKTLKEEKVIFANPAKRVAPGHLPPKPGRTLDAAERLSLLDRAERPEERLMLLLAGVHALKNKQIRDLTVDDADLNTGTLRVGCRIRRLDRLTLAYLREWLEHRRTRWPVTANPHLILTTQSAGGTASVTSGFVTAALRRLGHGPQRLRVDCILGEVEASDADPVRLIRLLGLSDATAMRYCAQRGALDRAVESGQVAASNTDFAVQ